jgi:rhodanese-related sulfurtransferase
MQTLTRDELKTRMDQDGDFVLIEALPMEYWKKAHLPGAINIPVDEQFEEKARQAIPDKSTPVITYCANTECPASRKAAERLEALGYENVLEYVAGKEDWQEAGLPTEP